ncbi:hypothetical protein [Chryseobacterium sp. 22543]|uniref:hypothetical protein n=1 Tax=Chryseobacterium sp. 22543 TaxID=3453940 RepID=UPI003F87BE60
MSTDAQLKKNVYNSWLNNFSQLTPYNKDKFYKIVGPVVIGLEILKLPRAETYRPHFAIYPLWERDESTCMKGPLLFKQIKRENGFQFDIPYSDHKSWKEEAFRCTTSQTISMNDDVHIEDIYELADQQLKMATGPADAAAKYLLKLFSAVYISDWTRTENILDELQLEGSTWNPLGFDFVYGPFEKWYKSLEEMVRNRDRFLMQISHNLESNKLSKMKRSELLS